MVNVPGFDKTKRVRVHDKTKQIEELYCESSRNKENACCFVKQRDMSNVRQVKIR